MSDAQQPPPLPGGLPPYPPAPPPPPRIPSSQRFPTWKQAFVMFGGGFALAVSACFGCMVTLDLARPSNPLLEGLPVVLAILVVAGLLATLIGVVFLLMRILHALFAKKDDSGGDGGGAGD